MEEYKELQRMWGVGIKAVGCELFVEEDNIFREGDKFYVWSSSFDRFAFTTEDNDWRGKRYQEEIYVKK